jgi:hypothetical protein
VFQERANRTIENPASVFQERVRRTPRARLIGVSGTPVSVFWERNIGVLGTASSVFWEHFIGVLGTARTTNCL